MESAGSLIYNNKDYREVLNKHFVASRHIHQGFFTGLEYEDRIVFNGRSSLEGGQFHHSFSKVIDDFFATLFNRAQEKYLEELLHPLGIKADHRILDIGCGVGSNAIWLARKYGCQVHCIDLSHENIETARRYTREEGLDHLITFECIDAAEVNYPDASFDHAFSVECFYFIDQKEKLLKKLLKLLKDDGIFAISDYVLKRRCGYFTRYLVMCQYGTFNIMQTSLYQPLVNSAGFQRCTVRDVTADTIIPGLNLFKLEDFRSVQEEYQALEGKWMGLLTTALVKRYALPLVEEGRYGLNFFHCYK
ncbi:methyltransferase domain-containing protein [Aquabacterium sp. A7-Y]|uniref:SAM-dependent methyltransferase n=1 Tax=Aquabacterium sp. A7-Y TaxID=1349605 RepID=UPI00223E4500|nr:class I SAM-dependent methyltransferase [Aquabacterium sp. A7-Y]MCW7539677.1 methyltransferase domain-containing protein [Aquabacterium sp. A7-Y]